MGSSGISVHEEQGDVAAGPGTVSLDHLRGELGKFVDRPTRSAVRTVVQDSIALAVLVVVVVVETPAAVTLLAGAGVGLVTTNFFMIAHDAAHGSFTRSRRFNAAVQRVGFAVTFHPVSGWRHVHHEVHHADTGDRDVDVVWRPLSPSEYAALPRRRRSLERAYRTTPGFALYYVVELWARELMGVAPRFGQPRGLLADRVVVLATMSATGIVGWLTAGWAGALALTVIPLVVVSWAIGFVVYFNHTHPLVRWRSHDDPVSADAAQFECTVRLVFPQPLRSLLGNIMEHPAHHVHPGVPLANLRRAQEQLESLLGDAAVREPWTPRRHRHVLRTCRLYDPRRHAWTDWDGRLTSTTRPPVTVTAPRVAREGE